MWLVRTNLFPIAAFLKGDTKRDGDSGDDPWADAPDPRFGSPVELSRRDTRGLLNLIGVGKTLSRKRIATEEAPPALLQIEPAGSFGIRGGECGDVRPAKRRSQHCYGC